MEGSVDQGALDVHHLVAGEHTGEHGSLDTLIHTGDVLLGDRAAGDLVDEFVALAGLVRLDDQLDMRKLALAARLPDIAGVHRRGLPDGLLVGNLGLADVGFDLELSKKPVHDDFQMELAHAGDDGLPGLLVRIGLEGRILFGQLLQRDRHLFLTGLRLGLNRHADDRLGEFHGLQYNRMFLVTERIACRRILQTHRSGDVTGIHMLDIFSVVGMHLQDTSKALTLTLCRVHDGFSGLQLSGVYPEEAELSDKRVCHDLERKSGEGRFIAGFPRLGFVSLGILAFHRRNIQR